MSDRNNEHRPVTAGLRIASAREGQTRILEGGTLTGLATRTSDNVPVLVTNFHVMVRRTRTRASQFDGDEEMYQQTIPSDADETYDLTSSKKIGQMVDQEPFNPNGNNTMDAAICTLADGIQVGRDVLHAIHNAGTHLNRPIYPGTFDPDPRMELVMVGATGGERRVQVLNPDLRFEDGGISWGSTIYLDCRSLPVTSGDSGAPCFHVDEAGRYKLVCILFAGIHSGNVGIAFKATLVEQRFGIRFGNYPPVVVVSAPEFAAVGTTVRLSSTGSRDPEGTALTYLWSQGPGADAVTLSDSAARRPTFVAPDDPATLIFKLTLTDADGQVASKDVTVNVVDVPAAPVNLTAEAGNEKVTLKWDDPQDPSITKYKVATKRGGVWGPYWDISNTDASTVEAVLGSLINGNSYQFQIRAVNAAGEGPTSAIAGPVTPAPVPDAPSSLNATPGDQQITLTWDDPGDASITGYEYRLSRQGATWPEERVTAAADAVSNRKITITGLKNGVAYNVRLRAVNVAGPGPEAQIGEITPEGDEEMGKSWIIDEYFRAGESLHCGDVAVIKERSGDPRVYKATDDHKGRVIGIVHTPDGKAVGDQIATTGATGEADQFVPIVVKGVARTLTTSAIGLGDPVVATGTTASAGSGKGLVATVEAVDD